MTVTLSRNFVEGMIKAATEAGADPEQLVRIHGRLSILMSPNIKAGCDEVLSKQATVSKVALAAAMNPAVLAGIIEHTVNEGKNALSEEMRCHLTEHQELTEQYKQASAMQGQEALPQDMLTRFQRLPLSDKIALLSTIGGTAGGAYAVAKPSDEDRAYGRGPFGRGVRGLLRGAGTAAGGMLGAVAGNEVADRWSPNMDRSHPLAALVGAGIGGMAGNSLAGAAL